MNLIYIQQLDAGAKLLIQHHTFNQGVESLLLYLTHKKLSIATDGSKYEKINGDSWSISLEGSKRIATGHDSNFGQVKQTSSYTTEVYDFLVSLLFIHH